MKDADILARVDRSGGEDACWPWTGAIDQGGYGKVLYNGRTLGAHRVVHMILVGPIPDGLELDHTCHNNSDCDGGNACPHRRCCNPRHAEAVTPRENTLRGRTIAARHAAKTHCPQGHPYDEANTYRWNGWRICRTCRSSRRAVA